MKSFFLSHKRNFISIFILTFVLTTFTFSSYGMSNNADNITTNTTNEKAILTTEHINTLGGVFAPLIAISQSPFISLTVLSGIGNQINSKPDTIFANMPMADMVKELPIANSDVFWVLLVITVIKLLLSLFKGTKVLSDAILGKLENWGGTIASVLIPFFVLPDVPMQTAELVTVNLSGTLLFATPLLSTNIAVYLISNLISFIVSALSYVIYFTMKTMILAIDILAFLFSVIPGSQATFTVIKNVVVFAFTLIACADPYTSSFIGIVILLIAFYVFEKARRLEMYYRKIYIIPFYNAIFRRSLTIPIILEKMPRGVEKEFGEIEICLEAFMMNKKKSGFYKRELCYFIRDNDINYVFKKRLLRKTLKIELESEIYIEKCFQFMRIFTDENLHISQRKISLVLRREHNKNIPELIDTADLIDYNELLEEREQQKAAEKALIKAEKKRLREEASYVRKQQFDEKINIGKDKFGGVLGQGKNKIKQLKESIQEKSIGMDKDMTASKECTNCKNVLKVNEQFCPACGTKRDLLDKEIPNNI